MDKTSHTYETALHRAAAYCSTAERCILELQEKLTRWEVDEADQAKIIEYLIREKFIDENRYAVAYAKDKFKYNKWGKIKIRHQLILKQIDKNTIEAALSTIDNKAYTDMLFKLAKDKNKKISFQNVYEQKGKLVRFLAGKGFELDAILGVLKEVITD